MINFCFKECKPKDCAMTVSTYFFFSGRTSVNPMSPALLIAYFEHAIIQLHAGQGISDRTGKGVKPAVKTDS